MKFYDDEVTIKPLYQNQRNFDSCEYWVRDVHLFYERTYVRRLPRGVRQFSVDTTPAQRWWAAGGPPLGDRTSQWFPGCGTKAEIKALANKHGGFAEEEHYPEDPKNPHYFLMFQDTEKALAFCRTEDFDILCITMAKLP
jgi:hypothetical protein